MVGERNLPGRGGGSPLPLPLTPWRWNWHVIAQRDPTRFLEDVFARPIITPVGGWLISALIGLVIFLTLRFADTAHERAFDQPGAVESGIIPEPVGLATVAVIALLALIVGWEPIVSRWLGPIVTARFRPLMTTRYPFLAWPRRLIRGLLLLPWRAPSIVLSALDWFLARPIAILAGVRIADLVGRRWSLLFRYLILAFWIVGSAVVAGWLDGPVSLWAMLPGFLAIFGVVRRWAWVERDREAFLIERGGPAHKRVGFQEDLRDEALTAMVGLFALIPLALRQADMSYDAFDLFTRNHQRIEGEPTLLQWVAFFGAELAKSLPFVDWSEVYHVDNGSPIEPHDRYGVGATLVFVLRATLDLLLLAAVLQAVQIAGRLREQNIAFRSGKLPILDPFAEYEAFRRIAQRDFDAAPVLRRLSDRVADFPSYDSEYDERRLAEIVAGDDADLKKLILRAGERASTGASSAAERDPAIRETAMLALAGQHPGAARTRDLLSALASQTKQSEITRIQALTLLAESSRMAAKAPLIAIAGDSEASLPLRLHAFRELGRFRLREANDADARDWTQFDLPQPQAGPSVLNAYALLWMAKAFPMGFARATALELAAQATTWEAAMPLAYALALAQRYAPIRNPDAKDPGGIAAEFPEIVRTAAHRAACSGLGEWDRMAPIPDGVFDMSSTPSETGAFADEYPRHRVRVPAFELGAYAATFEEYDAYRDVIGAERPDDQGWGRARRPVINVSWEDADAYCSWLNAWSGERFRLPSEAEWEYACRAGTTTPFSFGETIAKSQAQFSDDLSGSAGKTVPVGSFPPNAFGLYEMHGNVWEWCADQYGPYLGAPEDGAVLISGSNGLHVNRGGSWELSRRFLRSASRWATPSTGWAYDLGFRIARTP